MTTRDRILWIVFALCALGAIFFWTQPARRAAALRRASLSELATQAKQRPDDAQVLFLLGDKLRKENRLPEAYDAFAQAAELAPRDFASWSAAADLAEVLHGRQGAFDLVAVYIRNNPDDGRGHLAFARLCYLSQLHGRAIASAQTALRLDPKLSEAWRIIGWEKISNDARADAKTAMQKAVETAPDDFRNHVALGDVLTASERPADAIASYRQALKLAPEETNAQIMLARALIKSRPNDQSALAEAEPLTRKSLARDDSRAVTHATLAEIFERRGDRAAALQEYETATLLDPRYTDAGFQLSQIYRGSKDEANFRKWLERSTAVKTFLPEQPILRQRIQRAKTPEEARILSVRLARQTASAGILMDAVAQLQSLLQQKDDPALAALLREIAASPLYRTQTLIAMPTEELIEQGNRLLARGKAAQAFELYFLAVRRNRFNAVALQNVGLSLLAQGKPNQATPFLSESLRNNPDLPRAHFALGDIAAQNGLWEEARAHYELGVLREPESAEAQFRLGEICRENQQQSDSYTAFGKAYTLAPKTPRYAREWADALEEQGKLEAAETVLRASLGTSPKDSETQAQLGTLLLQKSDKLKDAETLLKTALAADPTDDFARYGLAQVVLKRRPAEARTMLEDLTRRNPAAREMWVTLGQAARQMGDIAGSRRALDRARVLEQKFLAGRTLAGQVSQRPDDDAVRVQLARAQADAGETLKALSNYDFVLRRQPRRMDWKRERERLRSRLGGANAAPDTTLVSLIHESLPTPPRRP